jgi:hypothetical protein
MSRAASRADLRLSVPVWRVWVSDDYVIEDFDFQKLASANQVTRDLYIGFAWRGLSARVVVHNRPRALFQPTNSGNCGVLPLQFQAPDNAA